MALKPYKRDFGYSYSYGVSATLELLFNRPSDAVQIHIHEKGKTNTGVSKLQYLAKKHGIPVNESSSGIDNLTSTENTYAVGVFRKFVAPIDESKNHVVLAGIQDKGNLGTIIRAMIGFGFQDLAIIKPSVDIFDPKVVRASMGAFFRVRHSYFSTFADYQAKFARNYYPFMTDGAKPIDSVVFAPPYSLIFGSESEGLAPTFKDIGTAVSIPQSNWIDSLNLSIATGIALYEAHRQG